MTRQAHGWLPVGLPGSVRPPGSEKPTALPPFCSTPPGSLVDIGSECHGRCPGLGLRPRSGPVQRELNILALIKGAERYVFVHDDESRDALIDLLRDKAADP